MRIDPDMEKWADILIGYSLKEQAKELNMPLNDKPVLVIGETVSRPLMEALEVRILKEGAHPVLIPHFPTHKFGYNAGLPAILHGTEKQRTFIPEGFKKFWEEAGGFVYIIGTEEPYLFRDHSERFSEIRKANKGLIDLRMGKPWTGTLFPTHAESVVEGFPSLDEYADFILKASLLDYKEMSISQDEIKGLMDASDTITVKSYDPDKRKLYELNMNIGENKVIKGDGKINVPDGEVFTSPYPNSVEGEIYLDIPIIRDGAEISGVYLKFEKGRIVDYSAQKGLDKLRSIIETDEGSHKAGEIAVATNYEIVRSLMNELFAEKIGGTIHLAVGSSYEMCYPELDGLVAGKKQEALQKLIEDGRFNPSSQHLDLPKDYRNPQNGEELIIGSTLVVWKDNKWTARY
ncbi:aminopeptidase [Candidatus Woesearchaeota archaeon]|nr:aminopeptidase [Candidatus Woesearchaeota archaeon]